MIVKLRSTSVQAWFSDFVRALDEVQRPAVPVPARGFAVAPFGREDRSIVQTR
jgi:hypothetical protein